MLTENMKAITDVAEQIIKDNGYLTKNNLQESFNEVINQAEVRGGHLEAFEEGARWTDRTLIEKACEWLLSQEEIIGISFENDFIERFKKAMEE